MKYKLLIMLALSSSLLFAAPKKYNGAELYSQETFQYGRFEARMYMAAASGLVSSMFLYYNDSYKGLPEPWREIDIEVLGKSPESFQSNLITGNAAKKVMSMKHHDIIPVANQTYHTYAMEWTPDSIAWYIDDVQVRVTTGTQVTDLRDKQQNLRFNLWISNDPIWVGAFDPASLPKHQFINWVKVYSYNATPNANGSHFSLKWQDDFTTFDAKKWDTANWTFDENLVDFSPENVTVKDGILVLSLTPATATGFSGDVPKDDGTLSARPVRNSTNHLVQNTPIRWFDLLGRTPARP